MYMLVLSLLFRLIRRLISLYATSMNIELQQRSIEFSALFRSQEQIRLAAVVRIMIKPSCMYVILICA